MHVQTQYFPILKAVEINCPLPRKKCKSLKACLLTRDFHVQYNLRAGAEWSRSVCAAPDLESRARRLLEASPCDRHRTCQVLSPVDLQALARNDEKCFEAAQKFWRTFHAIKRAIDDFSEIFVTSLDIDRYSVMFDVDRCQVRRKKSKHECCVTRSLGFLLLSKRRTNCTNICPTSKEAKKRLNVNRVKRNA